MNIDPKNSASVIHMFLICVCPPIDVYIFKRILVEARDLAINVQSKEMGAQSILKSWQT